MSTSTQPRTRRYSTALRYTERLGKARYIADKYREILGASVLDVGCDQKQLREHLAPTVRYVGVDFSPAADVRVNLDRERLPFRDGEFETVLAADVLEHLDQIHAVFDELCRVSASRVVVSLPNPLRNLLIAMAKGSDGRLKYYGLPVEPPPDRHRWFFGAEEAGEFLRGRGHRNGFEVEQIDVEEVGAPKWVDPGGKSLTGSENVRAGTTWCVLLRTNVVERRA